MARGIPLTEIIRQPPHTVLVPERNAHLSNWVVNEPHQDKLRMDIAITGSFPYNRVEIVYVLS